MDKIMGQPEHIMSTVSNNKTSHQKINMNMPLRQPKPAVASPYELKALRLAQAALSKAEISDNEKQFLTNVTEVYRLCRNIARTRIL